FEAWKKTQVGADAPDQTQVSSFAVAPPRPVPGQALEDYARALLQSVLDTPVRKPEPVKREDFQCNDHSHTPWQSKTSQPDAMVQLKSGGRLVVEVKDYTGKVPRRIIEKLLSDQQSHGAEFAMLVLGPQANISDPCKQMLADHGVPVVYLSTTTAGSGPLPPKDLDAIASAVRSFVSTAAATILRPSGGEQHSTKTGCQDLIV
ncbi:unnamed protein product, partial [Polarella glacialis]